jgi:nitrogen regulatory protein P-II 1
MQYLVVVIVDDPEHCPAILDAWEEMGVPGVTILESTGLGRLRRGGLVDDLPLMPSLRDLLESREVPHRTLFSVVPGEEMMNQMIATVQRVIGDLDEPDTGFLFVTPVIQAMGLGRKST